MTGFGEAELETSAGRLRVEIKTVNHRFFNSSLRVPYGLERFESTIQGWLKEALRRGHVNYSLRIISDEATLDRPLPVLDLPRAERYRDLFQELRTALGFEQPVDLALLARFGDIFRAPDDEGEKTVEIVEQELQTVTSEAVSAVLRMRESEGDRLAIDLRERLEAIRLELGRIDERAPLRLIEERDRLRAAIQELAGEVNVDEERLAKEVAYTAERWDLNEELVRFRSHLELFEEVLDADLSAPAGKRLGFLVQEMHREGNTIGSKANDSVISHASIAIKEEIERLREQVENVE